MINRQQANARNFCNLFQLTAEALAKPRRKPVASKEITALAIRPKAEIVKGVNNENKNIVAE